MRGWLFASVWMISLGMFAQTRVQGTVTDVGGTPMIGVNVVEKGTLNGTVTDSEGNFTLNVASQNSELVFTYVGYITEEVLVGSKRSITVVMVEDMESLQEIVVVGYGTQAKRDITGSVAVVNTKELLASSGASATQQLQGKTPGVYIGQTGSPGSATMVRIRGVNTINDNGPLYVIDGVSTRNQNLSSLNPNDIESMQVLKDASSAAIYGAQAANGVILITTKRGTGSGQPKLSYDAYYGMQKTGRRYDLLNSADRLAIEWESQSNALMLRDVTGQTPSHPQFGTGASPEIPQWLVVGGASKTQDINDYSFPDLQMVPYSDTDWWDAIDRVAPIQNHQLTLSGGGAKGRYLMGLNYFDQQGTVIHTFYTRYQTRLNTSFDIRPWLRMGENLQYTWTKDLGLNVTATESTHYSWTYRASPWVPVKDTFGNWGGSKITGTGNWQNPVAMRERERGNYWSNSRIFGNVWAEADLMKGLMFRTSFGLDYTNAYSYYMSKKNPEFSESPGTNHFQEAASFNFRWVWTNTLTYNKVFEDIHSLNVTLGTEAIRDGLGRGMEARRYHYLLEDNHNTWVLPMGANDNLRTNNSWYNGEFALFGVFGRADYAFADKYLFTGIVRRDGVSRFAKKNRYGTFPSMSVGWRMSEENFMDNTREWLDDLKLRVGYGHTGNAEIPRATNFAMLFGTSPDVTNYDLGGSNTGSDLGYRLATYGNEDTRWEAIKMTNVGIDATFGQGRFSTTLEFYNKVTSDMLIEAGYSALANTEIGRPYINYGSMRNRGFDFMFNYRDKAGDWAWDIGLNASTYKNKVLKLSDADDYALWGKGDRFDIGETRTIKGRAVSEFYGFNIIGFYEDENDVLNSPIPYKATEKPTAQDAKRYIGKYKFEDVSGPDGVPDGRITMDDRKVIGSPHPDLILGLNAALTYKNWDFSMFWYSTIGNDLLNNTKYFTDFPLFAGNRSTRMRDLSWKMNGDNSKAELPILDSQDDWTGTVLNSYYIEDGSFVKLKNLVVGYTFPKTILDKVTISNLRLYIQAENLLTLTKYTGLDPEITNRDAGERNRADLRRGIDGGGWPTTMRFLFGVNFEF
ncbi:TonB-dependent receptor [Proteiniphilum sp. X52]|uniref:SusC/RagA family TonB-linked outer membrane protein n=1 Tax=Proteiniphilum sp. X52 TaxID=2382159 RepID=UPI000F09B3D8|nr:TonB-dependent receptor [Proteiniphilum sp. X52]RNC64593.1 TonB-dependent receptor [Proteiniphilum sp. X52]